MDRPPPVRGHAPLRGAPPPPPPPLLVRATAGVHAEEEDAAADDELVTPPPGPRLRCRRLVGPVVEAMVEVELVSGRPSTPCCCCCCCRDGNCADPAKCIERKERRGRNSRAPGTELADSSEGSARPMILWLPELPCSDAARRSSLASCAAASLADEQSGAVGAGNAATGRRGVHRRSKMFTSPSRPQVATTSALGHRNEG